MKKIRCLLEQEKQDTRVMYEDIFSEDSREFIDYYYSWKTQDNEILVMEDVQGYEVMLHLNPYTLLINGIEAGCRYIVAVATQKESRGKGKMRMVMKQAFEDMYFKQMPLTFLLPADAAYYQGQGFVYFPCQLMQQYGLTENIGVQFTAEQAAASELSELARFSNAVLQRQYDVYIKRDENYYKRLLLETACEGGDVLCIKSGECVAGVLSYGMEKTPEGLRIEIKELILAEEYQNETKGVLQACFREGRIEFSKMYMMVRIINLKVLGTMLRSPNPYCRKVKIQDSLVMENNGCFLIQVQENKSSIVPITDDETEPVMDISKLTEILFQESRVFLNEWV